MKYAVINNAGLVVNSIELEPSADYDPPEGHTLVSEEVQPMEIGGTYVDGIYTPPQVEPPPPIPEPEPGTTPSRLIAAAYNLTVAEGDITNIGGIFNLIAALYLDVGLYMLLFSEPQPDADYFTIINSGAPSMQCIEQGLDYLIIEAKDAVNGSAVDPSQFSVEVKRI